jgi:hypothetical protein
MLPKTRPSCSRFRNWIQSNLEKRGVPANSQDPTDKGEPKR